MRLTPRQLLLTAVASIALSVGASTSHAQYSQLEIGTLNKPVEPYKQDEVGVDEKLGNQIPKDAKFFDEEGRAVTIGSYLSQGRPIILWMGYYECPMLCDLMSAGMVGAVKDLQLDAGKEFAIVNVSIDPNESSGLANAKKQSYLKEFGRPGAAAAWNLLTGPPESISSLADAVGYKFKKVTIEGEAQYAHPAVLMILSPDGKVTRYLYPNSNQGVQFDSKTMRLSLIEASDGTVGSTLDKILLTCLRYDSHTGKYTLIASRMMQGAGLLTVLTMGAILIPLWLRSAKAKPDDDSTAGPGKVAMQG